jgi:hypothetical protein
MKPNEVTMRATIRADVAKRRATVRAAGGEPKWRTQYAKLAEAKRNAKAARVAEAEAWIAEVRKRRKAGP